MEIQHCLKILELDEKATLDDAKACYKDLVNIWHPDRFSNNPRLKQKAEDKLKEINVAYETVVSFLSSQHSGEPQGTPESEAWNIPATEMRTNANPETQSHKTGSETAVKDKTEAFVETGTEIVLGLFSSLYTNFRRMVSDAKAEIDRESPEPRRKKNDVFRGKHGRGNAGRRPGRGRGNRGRGRGK